MKVSKILVKHISGEYLSPEKWELVPETGLRDSEPPKPNREISLLCGEKEDEIRAAQGFCSKKFKANITTEGVDYSALEKGTRLKIGEAVLEITAQGKRCFDECPIRSRGEHCPLCVSCAFAKVLTSGEFSLGSDIEVIK